MNVTYHGMAYCWWCRKLWPDNLTTTVQLPTGQRVERCDVCRERHEDDESRYEEDTDDE